MGALGAFNPSFLSQGPQFQPESQLETYGKYLSLRGMLDQQNLRAIQLQQEQLQLQQTQQAAEERRSLAALYSSGSPPDPNTPEGQAAILRVAPLTGMGVIKQGAEFAKERALTAQAQAGTKKTDVETQKAQQNLHEAQQMNVARDLYGMQHLPADQQPAEFTRLNNKWLKNGWITQDQWQANAQMTSPTNEQIEELYRSSGFSKTRDEYEQKAAELKKSRLQATAEALASSARTIQDPNIADEASYQAWLKAQDRDAQGHLPQHWGPGVKEFIAGLAVPPEKLPEYQMAAKRAQLMTQAGPGSFDKVIDQVMPPTSDFGKQYNKQAKAWAAQAQQMGVDPEKIMTAISSMSAETRRPAIAAATEAATGPGKIQQAVAVEKAKAGLSSDAFASVVDATERHKAEASYESASKEAGDKIAAARQTQDLIAAAQGGNKAAPGLIPLATVRSFVNRVNAQELQAVSGAAGSAMDRIQGWINKATEGQPIPPDILRDLSTIANIQKDAAKRAYKFKVDVLNKTYGSKVQPMELESESAPAASAAAVPANVKAALANVGPGIYTLKNGTKWMKDASGNITSH